MAPRSAGTSLPRGPLPANRQVPAPGDRGRGGFGGDRTLRNEPRVMRGGTIVSRCKQVKSRFSEGSADEPAAAGGGADGGHDRAVQLRRAEDGLAGRQQRAPGP